MLKLQPKCHTEMYQKAICKEDGQESLTSNSQI